MAMSKKDYQALARALYLRKPVETSTAFPLWQGVVHDIEKTLAFDNPRFDRARFIEACETGATKGMPR
jgi:hypothetical protein